MAKEQTVVQNVGGIHEDVLCCHCGIHGSRFLTIDRIDRHKHGRFIPSYDPKFTRSYLAEKVLRRLREFSSPKKIQLTTRQTEIARLLAADVPRYEIMGALKLKQKTMESLERGIRKRTGKKSTVAAIAEIARQGLL